MRRRNMTIAAVAAQLWLPRAQVRPAQRGTRKAGTAPLPC